MDQDGVAGDSTPNAPAGMSPNNEPAAVPRNHPLSDMQRTLFQTEDQLALIRLARLQASVGLFKALGGRWEVNRRVAGT